MLGVVAGLLIAAIAAAPRVVAFSPEAGSEHIPATTRLEITFNRVMDPASVQEHLSLSPNAAGRWAWEGTTAFFVPASPWAPGATIQARLAAGARSTRRLPILRSYTWTFTIGLPRIAYLWPAGDAPDIYLRTLDGQETTRLTTSPLGVYDFTLNREPPAVIYAAERADGGTDLHWLDLNSEQDSVIYPCPEVERCRGASLSSDGRRVAFERYSVRPGTPGPTRVWMLDIASGEAVPIGPEGHITASPLFSPRGLLAYRDSTLGAIVLVDPALGPEPPAFRLFPSELGVVGTWSPDGAYLIFPEIVFPEGLTDEVSFYSHLYRAEVSSGEVMDLWRTGFGQVEDAAPVYSPDGQWIAFARKHLEGELWSIGRQLWMMRADGSGARALSDEPDYNHSAIAWSPDSISLVYMRFNQSDFTEASEIWVSGLEEGQAHRLAIGGYLPQWVP
jgi:Tol biopolymer transport system component